MKQVINITTSTYYPHVNGLSIVAQNNVKALIELGYEVNVFTKSGCTNCASEKIFTFNIQGNGRLFNEIKGETSEYLHELERHSAKALFNIHHAWHSWNTNLALVSTKIKCRQFIYSHGTGFVTLEGVFKRTLRRILYFHQKRLVDRYLKVVDGIIFITKNKLHPRCYDQLKIDSKKITTCIYNSVSDREIWNSFPDETTKKINNFLTNNVKTVLNVSNYEKIKNQKFIIKQLIQKNKNFKLILVGSNPTAYFDNLNKYVERNGLCDRVLILYGLSEFNTDLLFRKSDIFAFTSKNDFVPLVLIEARKYGLPFISFITADDNQAGGYFLQNEKAYQQKFDDLLNLPKSKLMAIGEEGLSEYLLNNTPAKYNKSLNEFLVQVKAIL